jgi:predicted alpha/beta-hydrolase family hydrolase
MGCRAAVNVANLVQEDPVLSEFTAGVCCLAYPLHPVKQRDKLRDEPLLKMTTPVLFISGSKDEMADQGLLQAVVKKIRGEQFVHWLDGVNHGHTTAKERQENLEKNITDAITSWLSQLK